MGVEERAVATEAGDAHSMASKACSNVEDLKKLMSTDKHIYIGCGMVCGWDGKCFGSCLEKYVGLSPKCACCCGDVQQMVVKSATRSVAKKVKNVTRSVARGAG